jgi:PKD repeat protein
MSRFSAWAYRKSLTISNAGSELTGYPIKFTINIGSGTSTGETIYIPSGHCKSDFSDIRFYNPYGDLSYSYFIESYTSNTTAIVWVKFNTISISGLTIYLIYGNALANSESNGTNTFTFFEGFSSNTIGTVWTESSTFTTHTIENGGYHNQITVAADKSTTLTKTTALASTSICRANISLLGVSGRTPPWWYVEFGYNASRIQNGYWGGVVGGFNPNYPTDDLWIEWSDAYTTNNVKVYRNGTVVSTRSATFATNKRPEFFIRTASSEIINIYIKNVSARQYTATPPTLGTWTSEEYNVDSGNILSLVVTPLTGILPLTPTITVNILEQLTNFTLLYGDGETYSPGTLNASFLTTHTYDEFGTFFVHAQGYDTSNKLQISNATVTVSKNPVDTSFAISQTLNSISFTDTSTGSPNEWWWEFGDSSNSDVQNPTHIYDTPGTYIVTLYSSNQQYSDSYSTTITIANPIPTLNISIYTHDDYNIPGKLTFTPTITTNKSLNEYITNLIWTIDGTTYNIDSPTIVFDESGTKSISCTISNNYNISTTAATTITLGQSPDANFKPSYLNVITNTLPVSVQFTNLSLGENLTYIWNFGDGHSSTVTSPTNSYANYGFYNVTLDATNSAGTSTKTYTNCIKIHYAAKTFIEKLNFIEDQFSSFDVKTFEEPIEFSTQIVPAKIFSETTCYIQKEVPDTPGLDEFGNLSFYRQLDEWGKLIIGTINAVGHKILKVAGLSDQTGLTFFRTKELEETVYYELDMDRQ